MTHKTILLAVSLLALAPVVAIAQGFTFVPAILGSYEGDAGSFEAENDSMEIFSHGCSISGPLRQVGKVYHFTARSTTGSCAQISQVQRGKLCAILTPGKSADGGQAMWAIFTAQQKGCRPLHGKYVAH